MLTPVVCVFFQLHTHFHGKSGGYHAELKELLETLLAKECVARRSFTLPRIDSLC